MYDVIKLFDGKTSIPNELFYIGKQHEDIWGKGIPYPIFGVTNIRINSKDIQELGQYGTTIKFTYNGIEYIKHYVSREIRENEMYIRQNQDMIWTIVGKLQINEWNGDEKKQIEIDEFEIKINDHKESWKDAF